MAQPQDESEAAAVGRIAGMIANHLESEREDGVLSVAIDPAQVRDLARMPGSRASARSSSVAPRAVAAMAAAAIPPRDEELLALARAAGGDADPPAGLAAIAAEVAACTRCPLHRTRTKTVPGQGNPRPEIVFVGEGPGSDEDRQGLAFIGRAGQLLTRIVAAMEMTRDDVFIANIVKCRPTVDFELRRDRPPEPDEMHACLPYLRAQLALLKPKVIVALGATAVFGLLGQKGITSLRGKWFRYQGIDLMPTYHPSYLLRGGAESGDRFWDVWDDMTAVLKRMGRTPPEKKRPARR